MRPVGFEAIPHPYEPLLQLGDGHCAQQRSLERQRAKRAQILATARRLLAESGHERLTLRRIAEECEVTVQTVRNGFGRKEELIAQAVNEHTTAIWRALAEPSTGPMAFLVFPDIIRHVAVHTSDFLRGTITAAFANGPPLQVLQRHAVANKAQLLRLFATRNLIRTDVDLISLADHITKIDTMLMYEWSHTGDDKALWEKMLNAHRVLLLGALRPAVADRLVDHVHGDGALTATRLRPAI